MNYDVDCTCDRPTRGGPKTKGDYKRCAVCGGYFVEPKEPVKLKGNENG